MNYKAFYKSKSIVVSANSSLEARDIAAAKFKARKAYDVTVVAINGQMPYQLF